MNSREWRRREELQRWQWICGLVMLFCVVLFAWKYFEESERKGGPSRRVPPPARNTG
jgi:hypothetical protein